VKWERKRSDCRGLCLQRLSAHRLWLQGIGSYTPCAASSLEEARLTVWLSAVVARSRSMTRMPQHTLIGQWWGKGA
jgi:hypothetical protein